MKEKNYNLELVRMVSFIMVIAIHVTNYFCRAYGEIPRGEYLFSLAINLAARVSVPCFFMITGALLIGRDEPVSKHIRRFVRYLSVLAVWSVVYYLWNRYYMGTSYDLKDIFHVPTEAHLWYLYAMIPIYLMLPFFQILCRHMSIKMERLFLVVTTGAVLFNFCLHMMGEEPYYDLPMIGDRAYAWYVLAGFYLYKYRKHIRLGQRTLILTSALGIGAAFGITCSVTISTGEHYEALMTYGCPFVIVASAAFFLFMLRLKGGHVRPGGRIKKAIDLFSGCSFGIYLIHILFLDNYKKYVEPWDISAWIAVPGLVAAITLASFACVWVIRKAPGGKKIT